MITDTDTADFCPEGCYWQCQHRTVEDRLRLAYAPSEATREALATVAVDDHHIDALRYTLSGAPPRPIRKTPPR